MKNDAENSSQIPFTLLLFAGLRDAAGASSVEVCVSCGEQNVTVAELLRVCAQQHPGLVKWLPHIKVAVNCEYSQGDRIVKPDDEIALLPPVSGGAR